MADRVSVKTRSKIMASVRTRDTGPERALRRRLHALGYRYRVNYRALPGRPDIVFPRRRKAIFVHGCFWHGHSCRWGRPPRSRIAYWSAKFLSNRRRDRRVVGRLRRLGWAVLIVWQCELRDPERALARAVRFLES